jgi:hypothetical protein
MLVSIFGVVAEVWIVGRRGVVAKGGVDGCGAVTAVKLVFASLVTARGGEVRARRGKVLNVFG